MAANVIGIGHQNIVKVPCDENGCMRPDRLEEEIAFARREGMRPLCVVATAPPPFAVPTTTSMHSPPSLTVKGCGSTWTLLGVEVAWFSTEHRKLMNGVEKADSVCWDAHKMMRVPSFAVRSSSKSRLSCDDCATTPTSPTTFSTAMLNSMIWALSLPGVLVETTPSSSA